MTLGFGSHPAMVAYAARLDRIDAAMMRAAAAETARLELANARYFRRGDVVRSECTGKLLEVHDAYPGERIGVRPARTLHWTELGSEA